MSNRFPIFPDNGSRLRQRLIVAVAGVGILVAAAWLALIVVSRIDEMFLPGQGISDLPALPGVDQDPPEDVSILVMGLDRRPSEGDAPTRTDSMFIVKIDGENETAWILSIPRDSWVQIPFRDGDGYYENRINTAFAIGETSGYPGGGAALAREVVELNTGLSIDHYLVIDFEAFIDVIDELGGIDLYVTEEVYDPFYSRTELPGDFHPLYFEVGEQHMDGQTALDFARTRYGFSDLDRIQRQQQVIFAAIDRALERRLVSIDSLTDLWGQYRDAIETDINDFETAGFAALAAKIDPSRITALSLGVATVNYRTPFGEEVLLIDKEKVQEVVGALTGDGGISQEAARVEVQSDADGLANQVVDYLSGFGFASDALQTAPIVDGATRSRTEIIDYSGKQRTVDFLANLLAVPPEQVRRAEPGDAGLSATDDADIVVILGADLLSRDFVADLGG